MKPSEETYKAYMELVREYHGATNVFVSLYDLRKRLGLTRRSQMATRLEMCKNAGFKLSFCTAPAAARVERYELSYFNETGVAFVLIETQQK